MAFRGVFTPKDLTPAPCGILSVAEVVKHTGREYDERWIRGFSQEFHNEPTYVRLLTVNDQAVAGGAIADNLNEQQYYDYTPFFIEVESFQSTFGLLGEDRFAKVKAQLEAVTQKAVEREFWEGLAARAETSANGNFYLRRADTVNIPVSGPKDPQVALMILEQAISNSSVGMSGVIHMTRDVASILGSRILLTKNEKGDEVAITRLGTRVVIGSGYTGNGPIGDANTAASATNKWMFATTPPEVHLGKIVVVNEDLAQGADVTLNNMRIKAYRPAAVAAERSDHYAMRVTLPND